MTERLDLLMNERSVMAAERSALTEPPLTASGSSSLLVSSEQHSTTPLRKIRSCKQVIQTCISSTL